MFCRLGLKQRIVWMSTSCCLWDLWPHTNYNQQTTVVVHVSTCQSTSSTDSSLYCLIVDKQTWFVCVCVSSSIKRSNCYMVWAGESSSPGQGRNNNGLEIGCLVDTTNGLLTFTANGKELSTYYKVNLTAWYMLLNVLFHIPSSSAFKTVSSYSFGIWQWHYDHISNIHPLCPPPLTGRAQY